MGADEVPDGLAVEVATDEVIEAAVHVGDPWRRRTSVPLTALADRPLIALPRGTGIRRRLDEASSAAGVTPGSPSRRVRRWSWPSSPRGARE